MRELLETEQAYVTRLHLLDQASEDSPTPSISGALTPAQGLALAHPTDPVGWGWGSIRTEPLRHCLWPGQPHIRQPCLVSPSAALTRHPYFLMVYQPKEAHSFRRHR